MATHTVFPNWSLSLVMLVGCGTPGLNTNRPPAETVSKPNPSPEEITNRLDYWHEEATELHDMAARREREADVLSKRQEGGSAEELVTRMRTLAKQLHAAAEYADEQAQEAQRQVMQGITQ
ncbi:MAG TPA: hypothetical protein VGR71_06890 [Nitrospira sp.]|nr:hypothetical protein [Nitrospira sp.]